MTNHVEKNDRPSFDIPKERYYSVETAAKRLDCSQQYFRNLIRDKKIRYVKIGRMVRIPESELAKLITFIPSMDEATRSALRL